MIAYYFRLAWRSLRHTPVLTALMVLAIGLGIGASMTMLTVVHVMSGDPLPGRSDVLYVPHLDAAPTVFADWTKGSVSDNLTYPDAMALLASHRATRQAIMAGTELLVSPAQGRPFYASGRMTTPDLFAMFGVPFAQGAGWSDADERQRARVMVLTAALSQKVFGTIRSVGRSLRMEHTDYRIVGVIGQWAPQPMFYGDPGFDDFTAQDQFFMPMATALDVQAPVNSLNGGWSDDRGVTSASRTWVQMWVQLDTASQAAAYLHYLRDYSAQQKQLGRFQRPPENAALFGLMQWLQAKHALPEDLRLQTTLALAFLGVCMLNIVALLLAKFLRRSGEISVRRALGARRSDIFSQLCIESLLLGVAGGALGVALAEAGLWKIRQQPDVYAQLAHMSDPMLAASVALALLSSFFAAALPAWRAARIAPAFQLKTQ